MKLLELWQSYSLLPTQALLDSPNTCAQTNPGGTSLEWEEVTIKSHKCNDESINYSGLFSLNTARYRIPDYYDLFISGTAYLDEEVNIGIVASRPPFTRIWITRERPPYGNHHAYEQYPQYARETFSTLGAPPIKHLRNLQSSLCP